MVSWYFDKMTFGKMTFGKMTFGKLTFWQVDVLVSWLFGSLPFLPVSEWQLRKKVFFAIYPNLKNTQAKKFFSFIVSVDISGSE
jgi:hypothetical protein